MLCLPSTMCGPFCSVPPVGIIAVVLPALMASRTSTHVRFSRKTVLGFGCATAGAAERTANSVSAHRNRIQPPLLFFFDGHPAHVDARHRSFTVNRHLFDRLDDLQAIDDAAERRVLAIEYSARREHDEERHVGAR